MYFIVNLSEYKGKLEQFGDKSDAQKYLVNKTPKELEEITVIEGIELYTIIKVDVILTPDDPEAKK